MQSELESVVLEKSLLKNQLHELEQQLAAANEQNSTLETEITKQKLDFDQKIEKLKVSLAEEHNRKVSNEASEKIKVNKYDCY